MSFAQLATSITTAASSALSGTKHTFTQTGLAGVRSTINKLRARLALSPITSNDPKKIEAAIKATAAVAQKSSAVPKIVVGALLAVAAVWAGKQAYNKRNTIKNTARRQGGVMRKATVGAAIGMQSHAGKAWGTMKQRGAGMSAQLSTRLRRATQKKSRSNTGETWRGIRV